MYLYKSHKDVFQILCVVFIGERYSSDPSDKYIEVATYLDVLPT
jgi:hypothetical protein